MAQEKPFSVKIKEFLYKMGFSKFGTDLLRFHRKGSEEWFEMAGKLFDGKDMEGRKLLTQQITMKGFFEKYPKRQRLMDLMLEFMRHGVGDEKRAILKFIFNNPGLFSKDDDQLTGQLFALQRDRDMVVSNTAEEILEKLGFEVDRSRRA